MGEGPPELNREQERSALNALESLLLPPGAIAEFHEAGTACAAALRRYRALEGTNADPSTFDGAALVYGATLDRLEELCKRYKPRRPLRCNGVVFSYGKTMRSVTLVVDDDCIDISRPPRLNGVVPEDTEPPF